MREQGMLTYKAKFNYNMKHSNDILVTNIVNGIDCIAMETVILYSKSQVAQHHEEPQPPAQRSAKQKTKSCSQKTCQIKQII